MKRGFGLHVGSSSILVVFVLLCLTTFATLSMVSANADYRLMQRTAEASSSYYLADETAEKYLAEIDEILWNAQILASNAEGYRVLSQNNLNEWAAAVRVAGPDGQQPLDYRLSAAELRFEVPIDPTRSLAVTLELGSFQIQDNGSDRFRRVGWKVVMSSGAETEIAGAPDLWDGGDLRALFG